MTPTKVTFWFSQEHADWYHYLAEQGIDKCPKNFFVSESGEESPYTACSSINSEIPYEGALDRFPDYVKIGEGTYNSTRTRGTW